MRARVPQDVDLEDKLVFGLSPVRFGYLVIAGLGALSLWKLEPLPAALRLAGCLVAAAGGALLAWGRWQGRPVDCWVADVAIFARRNRRLVLARPRRRRRAAPPSEAVPLGAINAIGGADRSGLEPAA
jgi:PrgI family protein